MLTLVMLNWKRPDQAAHILRRQRQYALIQRAIVWNNNPDLHIQIPEVDCINSSIDFGLYTRFNAAVLAETDAVLIQDDDLIVPEETIEALYAHWLREPGVIHGTQGRTIRAGRYQASDTFGAVDIVLTRCLIVHREICLEALKYQPHFRNTKGDGDDIVLSAAAYSRTRRKNRAYPLPYENLEEPHAISRRPGHIENRTGIARRCTEVFSR